LREVTDELTAFERRAGKRKPDPVSFSQMLLDALAAAFPSADNDNNIVLSPPEDVMVEGPVDDLRDLVSSLFEYAGSGPIDLRTRVKQMNPGLRAGYATELD
jgi:hypothetical protein